jgi:hypothetical protein
MKAPSPPTMLFPAERSRSSPGKGQLAASVTSNLSALFWLSVLRSVHEQHAQQSSLQRLTATR